MYPEILRDHHRPIPGPLASSVAALIMLQVTDWLTID